jgi:hypothetical protein
MKIKGEDCDMDFGVALDQIMIFALMLAPFIIIFLEMGERKKYPIRVWVLTEIGGSVGGKSNVGYYDRIGYMKVKDSKGKEIGGSEWRLRSNKKTVNNFSMQNVMEVRMPDVAEWFFFMQKKKQLAFVQAVNGEKGEEFYGVEFNLGLGNFKPIFDSNRAINFFKTYNQMKERNKADDWMKENMWHLLNTGGQLLIVIFLFLCFMQLVEVSKNLGGATLGIQGIDDKLDELSGNGNTTHSAPVNFNPLNLPFVPSVGG